MDGTQITRPSLGLRLLESRAIGELYLYAWMYPLLHLTPRGDGHPVLVLPGFMASGSSTAPLRHILKRVGYAGHRWKLGRNMGPLRIELEHVMDRMQELRRRYKSKVSLVGWSLGGIYARELAWMSPDDVRQVITLGTPFRHHHSTAATLLYHAINGPHSDHVDPDILDRAERAPPVPCTSIYSKSDGIVPWQCSIDASAPDVENIRVYGSHCGLGHNPAVIRAIIDRLALPEGGWTPFDRRKHRLWGFPKADED